MEVDKWDFVQPPFLTENWGSQESLICSAAIFVADFVTQQSQVFS